MNNKKPIFTKALLGLSVCLVISVYLIIRAGKSKTDFIKLTGNITALTDQLDNPANTHEGKMRYIQLDNSERIFEIFIGKDAGDFKPDYEIIDSLKIGEKIDLYYDDNYKTKSHQINSLTQYIDRNGEPVFIRGGVDKIMGMVLMGLSIVMLIIILILKKAGKII
ncbi:MAG: hypothetical protein ABI723_21600 [Bacteroidia bacterium]